MKNNTLAKYNPQIISDLDPRICIKESCWANLPANILEPGPGQRGMTTKTKHMVGEEKYDPLGFRPLSISHGFVNDREFYFITDGLQRYTAITKTFGMDVKIPCFITENLSEKDQKYALFLINHNASLFSDKNKLWQNAVESGRDPLRKVITDTFVSYGFGIRGYDHNGNKLEGRKSSQANYFEQGDLLLHYVFGDGGRTPIAGGEKGMLVEFDSVKFMLEVISQNFGSSRKKTDTILILGLCYFYAKNYRLWESYEDAAEKCREIFETRSAELIIEKAMKIMQLKEMLDTGKNVQSGSRCATSWHGPAGCVVLTRAYEKAWPKDKKFLYRGYTESTEKNRDAMFSFEKYKGIQRLLRNF